MARQERPLTRNERGMLKRRLASTRAQQLLGWLPTPLAQLQQPRQGKVTGPQAEYEEFRQFQLAQQALREQASKEQEQEREHEELMARFQ